MPRSLVAISLMLVVLAAGAVTAGTIRHDRDEALYLALADDPAYAAAGQICTGSLLGSGVLISPTWVLTAGHMATAQASFRLGDETYNAVASTIVKYPGEDVGLFQLDRPVTDVAPAKLYLPEFGSELGREAVTVGFGRSGTGLTGETTYSGTKRAGQNTIDMLGSVWGWSENLLLVDFDRPDDDGAGNRMGSPEPLDLEYCMAHGDSGGGLFVDIEGQTYLAGVQTALWYTDGSANASYGDGGTFARVASLYDWITGVVPPNRPPVAKNDAYATFEDVTLRVELPGVIANDLDLDGDVLLTSTSLTLPANGTLSFDPSGEFIYMPNPGFIGADSFTYALFDGQAWSEQAATVTIDVRPTPAPGDADGNGRVDSADASILAAHWLQSTDGFWTEGDFNHDGRVDDLDASILAANWSLNPPSTPTPEPGTFLLLAWSLPVLWLLRYRTSRVSYTWLAGLSPAELEHEIAYQNAQNQPMQLGGIPLGQHSICTGHFIPFSFFFIWTTVVCGQGILLADRCVDYRGRSEESAREGQSKEDYDSVCAGS
ncbi:MAG: cadherin-like domain-containing protein [Pirellulales bacterium]|nr:cadherin-like domain-containing protein [Pirellulales bacterium]